MKMFQQRLAAVPLEQVMEVTDGDAEAFGEALGIHGSITKSSIELIECAPHQGWHRLNDVLLGLHCLKCSVTLSEQGHALAPARPATAFHSQVKEAGR
jgi:hypothetical protein